MDLEKYMFPVEERPVLIHDGNNNVIDIEHPEEYLQADYKALVRADTNQAISIVKKSYNVVENRTIINELFSQLVGLGTAFRFDESHSFVNNNKMRLMVVFPEITIHDKDSLIRFSLYLENSYDESRAIRAYLGFIRDVCTNGTVFGSDIMQYHHRHTAGFEMGNLKEFLLNMFQYAPEIQKKVHFLENSYVTPNLAENIRKNMGARIGKAVLGEDKEVVDVSKSQWDLYNDITHIISHDIDQAQRSRYQFAVAKTFGL